MLIQPYSNVRTDWLPGVVNVTFFLRLILESGHPLTLELFSIRIRFDSSQKTSRTEKRAWFVRPAPAVIAVRRTASRTRHA